MLSILLLDGGFLEESSKPKSRSESCLCLNFFHLLAGKPNNFFSLYLFDLIENSCCLRSINLLEPVFLLIDPSVVYSVHR
jgi:hypothetical protein